LNWFCYRHSKGPFKNYVTLFNHSRKMHATQCQML